MSSINKKAFKAYYTKLKSETAPYTHSFSWIARKGDFYNLFSEEQKEFVDQLEPLNIEARYPSHKEKLLKSLTNERCLEIIHKTKGLQKWIKLKL